MWYTELTMAIRRKLKTGENKGPLYDCPVDLDSLIMSNECSPEWIETNLNVSDDILYDAIRTSMFGNWILNLDFITGFSSGFRKRLYRNMDAFDQMSKMYFLIKVSGIGDSGLVKEIEDIYLEDGTSGVNVGKLFNPMTMLGNNLKDDDVLVLKGESTIRQILLKRIRKFLDTGNKDDVDFSHSLFLPTILNPKFFSALSEAEHVTILGNLDRYFEFIRKFERYISFARCSRGASDRNPAQCLVKHIFSSGGMYSNRVKMSAWKQLYKETCARTSYLNSIYDLQLVMDVIRKVESEVVVPSGHTLSEIMEWINKSEGVFESFELDCTLRNLDATDFFIFLFLSVNHPEMANGLVEFQDDATRDRLFKQLSSVMVPVKEAVDWKLNRTLVNSLNNSSEGNSEDEQVF